MSTLVVARKGRSVAMASDSLVTFGETRLPHGYEANAKIFEIDGSLFGVVGSVAHYHVLRSVLGGLAPEERQFTSREGLFETFRKLHPVLKERYFLNTKEHDSDPYESSQYSLLIANVHGIWGVESYREVFEFGRFWATGSGRRFALGAMHAVYPRARTATQVAEAGVLAGCEFDVNSAAPVRLHTLGLKG